MMLLSASLQHSHILSNGCIFFAFKTGWSEQITDWSPSNSAVFGEHGWQTVSLDQNAKYSRKPSRGKKEKRNKLKFRERPSSSTELKSEVTSYNGTFKCTLRNESMVPTMKQKSKNCLKATFFSPDKKNLLQHSALRRITPLWLPWP